MMENKRDRHDSAVYRIGEVAEILGVTKEGVRFLERKGLLRSVRDEGNRYRYYRRIDLAVLHQIRGYAAAGFTLEEAAELVLQRDEGYKLLALEKQEAALEEEINTLQKRLQRLYRQKENIVRGISMHEERSIRPAPAVYYFPLEGGYAPEGSRWLRDTEKQWMMATPTVMLAKVPLDQAGKPFNSYGVCVYAAEAEELGLILEGAILLPETQCLYAYICTPVGERDAYLELYDWTLAQGWKPAGDMLSIVQLSTIREGKRCNLNMIRMPVEGE